ncbi:MAG TPA: DNA helicase RecQ [Ruminococcus sp.]|nr:DNA helicase RecQ [Ruminococcus sp.]
MEQSLENVLKQCFGYDSFRKGQKEIITHILQGRDILGIMPTGAGKSICYQVPAVLLNGLTVVISPLISLMHDQVRALQANGIPAVCLNSMMTSEEYRQALSQVYRGNIRIVYVAPERLETQGFLNIVHQFPVAMVAVDEAHCVSQWGQDFRPSYLKIPEFLKVLPCRPVVSTFTATATGEVAEDIERILGLNHPYRVTTGFDRENLWFNVQKPRDKFTALAGIIRQHSGECGIVYCLTRKYVEQVTEDLCRLGIHAVRYHAGLPDEERKRNQDDFIYGRAKVIVATNAFGMGIDKSDVSYVIHYNMPKNLENYYQEAGRAGRDGSQAECTLFYHESDVALNRFMISKTAEDNTMMDEYARQKQRKLDEQRLWQMKTYCTSDTCLRQRILKYFGEDAPPYCGKCSSCLANYEQRDITEKAVKVISCIWRLHQNGSHLGTDSITDVLRGSTAKRYEPFRELSVFGIMKEVNKTECNAIIEFLLEKEWIGIESETLTLNRNSAKLLKEKPSVFMNVRKNSQQTIQPAYSVTTDKILLERLKECRQTIAKRDRVPAYIIFTDSTLQDMCRKKPVSDMAFLGVSGVGTVKLERYGSYFMKVIREYLDSTERRTE